MNNIPEKNPYTLEDILACKDFAYPLILKDYDNLVKFHADTNPKKFCGNRVLYFYQFRNLMKCKREGGKTIWDIYEDPALVEKLWQDAIKRNRRDKCPYPSPTDVMEAQRINTGAIVFFKASTAKYIYKKYQATSVLDFTAGWGGRMLGAMSLGIPYTGIDTNLNLKEGYDKMMTELPVKNKADYKMLWQSCLETDYESLDYDMILTSPPYVNMELYEGMTPFESDDYFYTEFLLPVMDKSYRGMKAGGHMCINISPKMFKKLTEVYGCPMPDEQIDLRQQMGQNYAIKSQDYIYVWKKP